MSSLRTTSLLSRAGLFAMTVASTMACGGQSPSGEKADAGSPQFVATQGDFAHFTDWEAVDGGVDSGDSLDGGVRTMYINHVPPHGSTKFPVGTIIVKTTDGAQTFAMAKRGGGFNPFVDDWEWFELAPLVSGNVQIVWRGTGPSGTLGYGDMPPTGCNECHLESFKNDFVGGTALQLASF